MNKIYKVVWSKVKNCYVVVSEVAKNVITGAVKSAKVGSSMASGLAMGALMAFVITGSAYASDITITATGDQTGLADSESGSVLLDSNYNNDGKLTINSDGKGIAAYQNGMIVTVKGLELNTKDTTAMLVAGDHANASLTVNAEGNAVKINGTGDAHGIAVKSQGGSAIINAADINVTATENGVYAREEGAKVTLNGANVTVESTNECEQVAHKGHAVYVDKNAQVNIDATGDVTLKADDGKYAIGIESEDLLPKAVVNVIADGNVDVDGQVFVDQKATIKVEGEKVTVDTDSIDAVKSVGGTVNVTATGALAIKSTGNDGVQIDEGSANLTGKEVAIEGGKYGVKACGNNSSDINVTTTEGAIKVVGAEGAIYSEGAAHKVSLNATNGIEVEGKVYVDTGSEVTLNAGAGDVTMENVDAWHGTTVNISGNNVTLNSTVADAIQGCDTTVNITAVEKIEINSDVKDGIESCASTVSLNAKNVEITSEGAWGVVGTGDDGSDIDITADTIKIAGQAGGIRNLAASDITVKANDSLEITGTVRAEASANGTKIDLDGKTITIDANGQRGVNVANGTAVDVPGTAVVNLGTDKTESITIKNATYGILTQYNGTSVEVKGGALTIDGGTVTDSVGIWAMNGNLTDTDPSDNTKVVIGEDTVTTIKNVKDAIVGTSQGTVDIAGDLYATATNEVIGARGGSTVNINSAANKDVIVQLKGDIVYDLSPNDIHPVNAKVNVQLTNSDSWLEGNIYKNEVAAGATPPNDEVRDMTLGLSSGATWTTDAKSFVNNLEVNAGNIVVENAVTGSITVDNLTGTSVNVTVDKIENGIIKVGQEDQDGVEVTVNANGEGETFSKVYEDIKNVVTNDAGDSLVDAVNVENVAITGDVSVDAEGNTTTALNTDLFVTGDVVADDVSLKETAQAVKAEADAREAAVKAEADAREAADKAIREEMASEAGRLDNRIDKVDAKIDKVGAMAAAMASLKTMGYDPEAPTEIAVGVGQYRGETGLAIGAFHYPNKNFMLNFSLSTAGDEVMGGIGATWKIGRKR